MLEPNHALKELEIRYTISGSVKAPLALRFKREGRSSRLLLFLLSRVCSQNRQIRKQSRASVPAFVYQMGQMVNKRGQVFPHLFLLSRVCFYICLKREQMRGKRYVE